MKVETCGDSWKVVKSVLIFIYAPVVSISLASKPSTQRKELSCPLSLSSLPLLPLSVPYLLLFCSLSPYLASAMALSVTISKTIVALRFHNTPSLPPPPSLANLPSPSYNAHQGAAP